MVFARLFLVAVLLSPVSGFANYIVEKCDATWIYAQVFDCKSAKQKYFYGEAMCSVQDNRGEPKNLSHGPELTKKACPIKVYGANPNMCTGVVVQEEMDNCLKEFLASGQLRKPIASPPIMLPDNQKKSVGKKPRDPLAPKMPVWEHDTPAASGAEKD
ncbi:hypothetical protein K2X30_02505 [bacterium]|jgi:hypothetical protein|nr:hypothetical protein [bacterium]